MALLIYGANGYTGELVARRAIDRGLRPILGGRDSTAIAELAARLGTEHRAFALDRADDVDRALAGVGVVLNCAGPFVHTAAPLVAACLRSRAHYLDITGEIAVFEAAAACDAEARAAGIMLLPGAGFDVVPSDCLAAHVAARLPTATRLRLAFQATGRMSRGTALTAIESTGQGGMVRRQGLLTAVPAAHRTINVDFGAGPVKAIAIPWGDVFTAYVTTGIPDIEVFVVLPALARVALRSTRVLGPVLTTAPVRRWLQARVRAGAAGPSAQERESGRTRLWAEARDQAGKTVVSLLDAPEGYQLTSLLAVALAERALAGDAPPGYQTPGRAYGKDFVLGFDGVTREDVAAGFDQ